MSNVNDSNEKAQKSNCESQKEKERSDKKKPEASYVERSIVWYLKQTFFQGYKTLKKPDYLPFTIIVIATILINTGCVFVHFYNQSITVDFVNQILVFEMFVAFALIIIGLTLGKVQNKVMYYCISSLILAVSIVGAIFLPISGTSSLLLGSKLIFFFAWVLISSISSFFIFIYFFTSFSKKIITVGMAPTHIFFGLIIKLFVYGSIPVYAYMMVSGGFGTLLTAIFGLIIALMLIVLMNRAPKWAIDPNSRNAPQNIKKYVPGIMNFVNALGFIYIVLFYHLSRSFSASSGTISTIVVNLGGLIFSALYIIQSLTKKITKIKDLPTPMQNQVKFQSKLGVTSHMKEFFGERGLILAVMGVILGYNMANLDSFFGHNMPLLSAFVSNELSMGSIYHRTYLIVGLITILVSIIVFFRNPNFQDIMVDKHTVTQVFKYIGGFFMRSEDGSSPIEYKLKEVIETKVEPGLTEFTEKVTKGWQSFSKNLSNSWKNRNKPQNKPNEQLPEETQTKPHDSENRETPSDS